MVIQHSPSTESTNITFCSCAYRYVGFYSYMASHRKYAHSSLVQSLCLLYLQQSLFMTIYSLTQLSNISAPVTLHCTLFRLRLVTLYNIIKKTLQIYSRQSSKKLRALQTRQQQVFLQVPTVKLAPAWVLRQLKSYRLLIN